MDYCLQSGAETASIWTGQPDVDVDGDGRMDGVRLDFDGDGLVDDALADLDNDGLADHAVLDLDDDGVAESRYTDDGSGTWTLSGGEPGRPVRWFGLDGLEHTDADGPADLDGDGAADRLLDVDRDGLADRALLWAPGREAFRAAGYVDADGDGRWDITLTDADGDGAADAAGRL